MATENNTGKGRPTENRTPPPFGRESKKTARRAWWWILPAALMGFIAGQAASRYKQKAKWELLFEDRFDGATLSERWEKQGGRWEIKDGKLDGSSESNAFILLNLPVPGDVRIEFSAQCVKDEVFSTLEAAVFCNASKKRLTKDGYFASLGSDDGVKLQRRDYNVAFNDSLKPEPGREYRLCLERIGGQLAFYVDGRAAVRRRDILPITGGLGRELVGLYLWNAHTRFDDFRVYVRGKRRTVPLMEKGNVLFEYGHFQEAAAMYGQIEQTLPGTSEAQEAAYRRGRSWLAAEKVEHPQNSGPHLPTPKGKEYLKKAEVIFQRLTTDGTAPWRQYAQVGLGEVEFERANFLKGLELAVAGAEQDAVLREAVRPLLAGYIRLVHFGRYTAAEACVKALRRLYPEDEKAVVYAQLNLAVALSKRGHIVRAKMIFDRVWKEYPRRRLECAAKLLAFCSFLITGQGQAEKALGIYEKIMPVAAARPDLAARTLLYKGEVLKKMDRPREAEAAFDKILQKYPRQKTACAQASTAKAALVANAGRPKEALALLNKVLLAYPRARQACALALIQKGDLLTQAGRRTEAAAAYQEVLTNYTDCRKAGAQALISQVNALLWKDGFTEILPLCDEIVKRFPKLPSYLAAATTAKGKALGGLGRFNEALRLFDEVLAKWPDQRRSSPAALLEKGVILQKLGRFSKAADSFAEVLDRYDEQKDLCAQALYYLADLRAVQGRGRETMKFCERIDAEYHDQFQWTSAALFLKCDFFIGRGLYHEAETLLEKPPKNLLHRKDFLFESRFRTGTLLQARGQFAKAVKTFTELKNSPTVPGWIQRRAALAEATTLFEAGREKEARKALAEISKKYPNARDTRSTVLLLSGTDLFRNGHLEEALTVFRRVPREFPTVLGAAAEALRRRGDLRRAQGHGEEAVALYGRVLKEYPGQIRSCAAALLGKGLVLLRTGRLKEAEAVLKAVPKKFPGPAGLGLRALTEAAAAACLRGRRETVKTYLTRCVEGYGAAARFVRAAVEATGGLKPCAAPTSFLGTRRNDYDFISALALYAAGKDAAATKSLQACLDHTVGKAQTEWPAASAAELLRYLKNTAPTGK